MNALVYLANHRGYFSSKKLDVTIVAYPTERDVNRALYQGEIDLGCGAQATVALNYLENRPQRIYSQLYRAPSAARLLSLNQFAPKNTRSILGKSIGIIRGSSSEYLVHRQLIALGIELNRIKFKHVEYQDAYDLLHHKVIDAFIVDEPLATSLSQNWDDSRLISTPIAEGVEIGVLYGRDNVNESLRQSTERVLHGLVQAQAEAIANPAVVKEAVMAGLSTRFNADFIVNTLSPANISLGLSHYLVSDLDETSAWMALIRKTPELKSGSLFPMLDRRALQSAEPRLVTLL